jgi:hypothetical protein
MHFVCLQTFSLLLTFYSFYRCLWFFTEKCRSFLFISKTNYFLNSHFQLRPFRCSKKGHSQREECVAAAVIKFLVLHMRGGFSFAKAVHAPRKPEPQFCIVM